MRFLCDFRGLNDITKKDSYPLPHVRDVIDKIRGAVYIRCGVSILVNPSCGKRSGEDRLSVPRGKDEFNVTPYGLCNAGATYQRMIDNALSGLPCDRILAYMDDIVIFSNSFYFTAHLSQTLQMLANP